MGKINLDQHLKNRDGKEFTEDEKPIELASTLLYALENRSQDHNYQKSIKCFELRKKIFKGGEVELVSEEITLLKEKAHEALMPVVFFAILEILEA